MKTLDITLKDLLQNFRNLFAIMFMFVVPILMTGMFYIMFGGNPEEGEVFVLPVSRVILVNQDRGTTLEGQGTFSFGEILTTILESDNFNEIMDVTAMDDAVQARILVDNQEAAVAVVIPENTTEKYMGSEGNAPIEVYQDPTLSIGPAIVKGIVQQTLDNFSSSKITLQVTVEQLQLSGVMVTEDEIQGLINQYLQDTQTSQPAGSTSRLKIVPPEDQETSEQTIGPIAMIMTGMTVFFVFFTGASTAQSILREEEKGTLPRMFSTPTPVSTILGGKYLSIVFTIIVQIFVLFTFGYLVFHIEWGQLLPVISICVGTTLAASAFGIFLISWIKTERQAGFMIGGLVTITGMAGMMPTFTAGMPNPPAFIKTLSLFVPQGWAGEGFQTSMAGGGFGDILPNIIALLLWAAGLFLIGVIRFRNRYA